MRFTDAGIVVRKESAFLPSLAISVSCKTDVKSRILVFLIKTGSESIKATLHRRWILFAGFVAQMENPRLPKCVMFGKLVVERGLGGGQKKRWKRCLLDDLRAFGVNANQCTTAAHDERKWRRTAEQGVERFMAKLIVAEKARAGLRHAVVNPNVTKNTKERTAQSKRARAGSLAIVD